MLLRLLLLFNIFNATNRIFLYIHRSNVLCRTVSYDMYGHV